MVLARETILLVDDDRSAQAAQRILAAQPYDVRIANSADQAFEILQSQAATELVVSELRLPGGSSGIALIRKIRLCYPATSVMLMTATRIQEAAADIPVLVKPFTASALIAQVEGLLAENRRIAESLKAAFSWNRKAKDELEAVGRKLRETIRLSRRTRSERFCLDLQQPGATVRTVLVAEDDAALRYSVCRFLAGCGFQVLDASDGAEALDRSRRHCGQIDLLLTDLQMHGQDGLQLLQTIQNERPGTETIVMTGANVSLPRPILKKPFELEDLLAEIVGLLIRR